MVTRRDVVTAGALGAWSAAAGEAAAAGDGRRIEAQSPEQQSATAMQAMQRDLQQIRAILQDGLVGPSVGQGPVITEVRRQFGVFLRSAQKFPDYCEVGISVFTDLYDWHVRHGQPIEVSRIDNRLALRFMFTWMVMRTDQDPAFVGIPYDRG